MEKSNKILEQIKTAKNAISEKAQQALYNSIDIKLDKKQLEKIRDACNAEQLKNDKINIYIKLLYHNYYNAFYNERISDIIQVLQKYTGKKLGEKTRQKLYDELKQKNIRIFLNRELSLYEPATNKYLNIYKKNNDKFIIDNTLQPVIIDDIKLAYYGNYIDNPANNVKLIFDTAKKIASAVDSINDLIAYYNSLLGGNMETASKLYAYDILGKEIRT